LEFLANTRDLSEDRSRAEDRHLKFHDYRDNLRVSGGSLEPARWKGVNFRPVLTDDPRYIVWRNRILTTGLSVNW
jgi:hypothetical protein